MVNPGEALRNAVMYNKPKMLIGLDQKVRGQVRVLRTHPAQTVAPPAERRDLTHPGTPTERGKPVAVPLGRCRVSDTDGTAGKGGGRKRRPAVMGRIGVVSSPHAKAGRLPSGLAAREPLANRLRRQSRCRQPASCWCGLPRQRVSAPGQYRAGVSTEVEHRVPQGAFERLERHAWKHARAVLRGGGGGNIISLPDRC